MKVLVFFLIVLLIQQASADNRTVLDPCLEDISKYCADVKVGGGKILSCLNSKKDRISQNCRNRAVRLTSLLSELQSACNNDLLLYCDNMEPGDGRLLRCIQEHSADLSLSCRVGIDNMKLARKDLLDNQWP